MNKSIKKLLTSLAILLLSLAPLQAATVITSISTTTTPGGNLRIDEITAGATTYSIFEQPTSTTVSGEYVWLSTGTTPGSASTSLLDDLVDTGVLNPGTHEVQFGRSLLSSETFVWLDGDTTTTDGVIFSLINSVGTVVSDPLSLSDTDGDVFSIGTVNRSGGGTVTGWRAGGWAVSIGEFNNVTGTATGIRIADLSGFGNMDPQMIAIATIPEPSTFAMLLGGMGILLGMRRRRR